MRFTLIILPQIVSNWRRVGLCALNVPYMHDATTINAQRVFLPSGDTVIHNNSVDALPEVLRQTLSPQVVSFLGCMFVKSCWCSNCVERGSGVLKRWHPGHRVADNRSNMQRSSDIAFQFAFVTFDFFSCEYTITSSGMLQTPRVQLKTDYLFVFCYGHM